MVGPDADTPRAPFWRAFPFDAAAEDGAPYSVRSVAPGSKQTGGRFDLGTASVLYLGETPAHAIAEVLRGFSGHVLSPAMLRSNRLPLALVRISVPRDLLAGLADLNDPAVLVEHGIRPDILMLPASHRAETQAISRRLHQAGFRGFRCWSAIHGGWHPLVLFTDRIPLTELDFHDPELLTVDHPAVVEAAKYVYLRRPGDQDPIGFAP
jgi:RES domain-containing protein